MATQKALVWLFYATLGIAAATLFRNRNSVVVKAFVDQQRRPASNPFRSRRKGGSKQGHVFLQENSENRIRTSGIRETTKEPLSSTSEEVLNPSSTRTNATLGFPPFHGVMDVRPGDFLASEAFACRAPNTNKQHRFRVKLFPRGGGGGGGKRSNPDNEVVGLYLQYLGSNSSNAVDSVDATFALRLKGQQRGRRFAVEWRAGMRFVSDETDSHVDRGNAKEFGFPFLQTFLLKDFLGIRDSGSEYDDPTMPVQVEVEVLIHDTHLEEPVVVPQNASPAAINNNNGPRGEGGGGLFFFKEDIRLRKDDGGTILNGHDTERVRVGKVVVPVLSKWNQRPKLFEQGTYPGVEYRILRILDENDRERFTSCPGAEYELKPMYPLVPKLEQRQWPVRVNEKDIPVLYTARMYDVLSVAGSVLTAATGLLTAFLLSQAVSLFFIPSKSMDPTLRVGDVLLVDKVSPKVLSSSSRNGKVGDIVLFSPPSGLQQIVARNGGNLNSRDLFVKRIAATPGDKVTVYKDGQVDINDKNVVNGKRDFCQAEPLRLIEKYIAASEDEPNNVVVNPDEVFVMGDCSSVSVDSRVWGPLKNQNIVGRPILRLWPLDRFGKVE